MPGYVWIALTVFVVGSVVGLVWATIRGVGFWKRGRPALKRMMAAADEIQMRSTVLEKRMAVLEARRVALERETGRLSISLARARVLFGAVQDTRSLLDGALVFFP